MRVINPAIYGHHEPLGAKKTDAKNKIKNNIIILGIIH